MDRKGEWERILCCRQCRARGAAREQGGYSRGVGFTLCRVQVEGVEKAVSAGVGQSSVIKDLVAWRQQPQPLAAPFIRCSVSCKVQPKGAVRTRGGRCNHANRRCKIRYKASYLRCSLAVQPRGHTTPTKQHTQAHTKSQHGCRCRRCQPPAKLKARRRRRRRRHRS